MEMKHKKNKKFKFIKDNKIKGAWLSLLLFLPPALVLFTLFVAIPMGEAAWYSVYQWNGYGTPDNFVGLDNFKRVFEDSVFFTAINNNLLIIFVSLFIQIPLALFLAILVVDKFRGNNLFRLIFFLPYILAEIAAGLIWKFVYDGEYGIIAAIYSMFGGEAPYVLADPDIVMYPILLVIIWKYFGFHMILFIAGLQQIDKSLFEAARIDGADNKQMFLNITLPLLKPTIKLSVFFSILGSIQFFDIIMPLTGGGPADNSQTMVSYLYNFGITRMDIGFGSAVGVVLFVVCVAFAYGYKRVMIKND